MFNQFYQLGLLHGYSIITSAIFVSYLLALSYIDVIRFQLPDWLTLSLLWVGLLLHAIFTPQYLVSGVIGAAAGYLGFWAIYWLGKWLFKREGLGYGDFKLMAALGAWMGWECLPFVAVYASIGGAIFYVLRFCFYRTRGEIPFGPFLATVGGVIYVSQQILSLADPRCVFCVIIKI
ncbi:A24 family peptidase [Serratia sp. M24T3]|uniref:A24 family peptidase n=1 Tax=Rouxiella sp. WC2420 TaxID=3234145 RepID=A0AB39VRP0_9GAMM|nr:A24 family peptidase [Serratia sp. M24T3]EIC82221.1 prepilin peptidase [Serratia sp. M24T3]